MHVVHITTVHQRYDNRIYLKECRSIAANGHRVSLVVADSKGNETRDQVEFVDIGKPGSRFGRMLLSWPKAFRTALGLRGDLYHLHDPELIPLGAMLSILGRRVIYDAHEDTATQILAKPYLNPQVRKLVSLGFELIEKNCARIFSGIVSASPLITSKFARVNSHVATISNFPIIGMFDQEVPWDVRENAIVYVGGITRDRGIAEVVTALALTKSRPRFLLGGRFPNQQFQNEVEQSAAAELIDYRGYVFPDEYVEMVSRSKIGINTALPHENYLEAFATKMFDYMSAGIPFICSNFPKWAAFIDKYDCGVAIDPLKPIEIASAIDRLLADPAECQRLGKNGRKAIDKKFNWELEEAKLLDFYSNALDKP